MTREAQPIPLHPAYAARRETIAQTNTLGAFVRGQSGMEVKTKPMALRRNETLCLCVSGNWSKGFWTRPYGRWVSKTSGLWCLWTRSKRRELVWLMLWLDGAFTTLWEVGEERGSRDLTAGKNWRDCWFVSEIRPREDYFIPRVHPIFHGFCRPDWRRRTPPSPPFACLFNCPSELSTVPKV